MYAVRLQSFFWRLWASLTTRLSIGAIILVGAITSLSGPLGTYEHVPGVQRWGVWFGLTVVAAVVFHTIDVLIEPLVPRAKRWAHAGTTAAGMAAIYAPVALYFFQLLNKSFGVPAPNLIVVLVAFLATFSFDMFRDIPEVSEDDAPAKIVVDWSKLGISSGEALLAISADDHYVRVQTKEGEHRVLLRFSDAMDVVATIDGIRAHRSHWVALSAIVGMDRAEGRQFLILENGSRIPISKKRMDALPDTLSERFATI